MLSLAHASSMLALTSGARRGTASTVGGAGSTTASCPFSVAPEPSARSNTCEKAAAVSHWRPLLPPSSLAQPRQSSWRPFALHPPYGAFPHLVYSQETILCDGKCVGRGVEAGQLHAVLDPVIELVLACVRAMGKSGSSKRGTLSAKQVCLCVWRGDPFFRSPADCVPLSSCLRSVPAQYSAAFSLFCACA